METYAPYGSLGNTMAAVGAISDMYTSNPSSAPILAALFMPAFQSARSAANRTRCLNNLKKIGNGLAIWKTDHDGKLPQSLAALHPDYIRSKELLVCPSDDNPFSIQDGFRCSYRYAGPMPGGVGPASRIVVAYEDKDHHGVRNVLFLDMHAAALDERQFRRVLTFSYKQVKNADWKSLSKKRRRRLRGFYSSSSTRR